LYKAEKERFIREHNLASDDMLVPMQQQAYIRKILHKEIMSKVASKLIEKAVKEFASRPRVEKKAPTPPPPTPPPAPALPPPAVKKEEEVLPKQEPVPVKVEAPKKRMQEEVAPGMDERRKKKKKKKAKRPKLELDSPEKKPTPAAAAKEESKEAVVKVVKKKVKMKTVKEVTKEPVAIPAKPSMVAKKRGPPKKMGRIKRLRVAKDPAKGLGCAKCRYGKNGCGSCGIFADEVENA